MPGYVYNTSTANNNPNPFTTPQAPYLTVVPDSLNGFNYIFGAGPSAVQTYQLSGGNLAAGNVSISASASFELSTTGLSFSPSLSLPIQAGIVLGQPVTVYVRLKAGLAQGQYGWEAQIHSGGGAPSANVFCLGEVNSSTSIYEFNGKSDLILWPNPIIQNQITILLNNRPTGYYSIAIHDLQGRLLSKQTTRIILEQAQTIQLPDLSSGSYIIGLHDMEGNQIGTYRFSKLQN